MKVTLLIVSLGLTLATFAESKTVYVDGSVESSGDGTSWSAAFKTIQEAIDSENTLDDDTVLVAPGVYSQPDQTVTLSSKKQNASVVITKKRLTLKSWKGKEVTHIVGRRGDGLGGNNAAGEAPATCVAIADKGLGSTVEGFTIRDGETSNVFGTSCRSAGVGNPAYAGNGNYPATCSNFWYVAYCTISNCCAGRGAAVSGGTIISCFIADNVSYNSTVASTYSYAYNCIFTRNGMTGRSAFDFWVAVNCSCANETGSERGAITSNGGDAYNCAFVDCSKGGDANNAGRVYSSVYDGGTVAAMFARKTVVEDTVTLETLASAKNATGHDQLFFGAVRNDFRPINGGYLYGKDGHYGKIEYTNLDFIPPAYRQRDFYGNKLADNAKIPIGVILPAVTPTTKPIQLFPGYAAQGASVDGLKVGANGQCVYGEKAGDPIRLGYWTTNTVPLSLSTAAGKNAYPLRDGTFWTRFVASTGDGSVDSATLSNADGIYYVDRTNGKDDDETHDGKQATTAFQSLQHAVESVPSGKSYVVYVAEGTYDNGSKEIDSWAKEGYKLRARVVLTSANGSVYFRASGRRDDTIIEGALGDNEDGTGSTALRCAINSDKSGYLSFSGFTFRKGRCDVASTDGRGGFGGGFLDAAENHLIVLDSVITDCSALNGSAGYFTAFLRCLFKDNKAISGAASSSCCTVGRGFAAFSVFEDNPACTMLQVFSSGAKETATYYSKLFNCTVYMTKASGNVRGSSGPLQNTIIISSGSLPKLQDEYQDLSSIAWGCSKYLATDIPKRRPRLFDPANGDYRPNENSPAWRAGTVPDVMKPYCTADYNGDPVDISLDGSAITIGAVQTLGGPTPGTMMLIR